MAIVLPHGVLFRGAAEGTIRQIIIEKNYLDAVIGLPANIFFGTGIPTTVLVFKKNSQTKDILFIDASGGFEKVKNRNRLRQEHIAKIVETYKKRKDVEKYAHLALGMAVLSSLASQRAVAVFCCSGGTAGRYGTILICLLLSTFCLCLPQCLFRVFLVRAFLRFLFLSYKSLWVWPLPLCR
ncbi:MAG: N-6 DNA methylase [Coriobacteriales bacterium]|jgi:hypothetical protein|nr:N-6 DNA methylase [Coriobacteriales bacterium]